LQILDRLENLYAYGFLRDNIKIANLCWGRYCSRDIIDKELIYLIDFGSLSSYDYPVCEIKGNNKFVLEYKTYKKEKINEIYGTPNIWIKVS
jgi:hypothetical protein